MAFKITNKGLYWWLIGTFTLLYGLVAFVSTLHAIDFFNLSNIGSLAILLGIAYEVGQASVLFSILMTKNKEKFLPWVLMILLTALQVTANVYASYKHMSITGGNDWQYWYTSILKIFGVLGGTTETYQVIISWISGALLPIIALGMTALVAQNIKLITGDADEEKEEPVPASDIVSEVSRARLTEDELAEAEMVLSKRKPDGYHDIEIPVNKKEEVEKEVDKIKKLIKDRQANGLINEKVKSVISPGIDREDEDTPVIPEKEEKVDLQPQTDIDDDEFGPVSLTDVEPNPIKVTAEVPTDIPVKEDKEDFVETLMKNSLRDDEVVPALSDEEVMKMFHDELEGKMPETEEEFEAKYNPTPSVEEEQNVGDEFGELLDIQDQIAETVEKTEDAPVLKTNNGLIELDPEAKIQSRPPEPSPPTIQSDEPPKDKPETEDERLERLRNIARENLKKK